MQQIVAGEGGNFKVAPWDWRYLAEKRRKAEFDFDEGELKPYLQLDRIIEAAFYAASRLFGLRFEERFDLKLYDPDVRAWTVTKGSRAPQGAGVIHTDFEHGFIRAETIAYDDYIANNGEAGARDAGKFRLEGKDYVVADGDVMHFRFNT